MKNFPAIAEDYVRRVLDGTELVCQKVRTTIERHVNDLRRSESDANYPYYFDPEACVRFCRLFELVIPSKWPTQMVMEPWRIAWASILYGWKMRTPVEVGRGIHGKPVTINPRRFRIAYNRWPRKTGKSATMSVQFNYHLKLDGERGAEVYSVALVEEQARRVFDEAVAMRDATPQLRKSITKVGDQPCRRMRVPESNSEGRPLSRDKESMEGLNVSYACGDEVHKWSGRGAYDVIRYGMRSRVQPLFCLITTAPAADDTTSVCNMLENYADKVAQGVIDDPRFFFWILEIDKDDDWRDESKWYKACPTLGVTVKWEDMRQEALEASNDAESLNAFQRYSLNIRVDAAEQAIATADWDKCARSGDPKALREETLNALRGRICFAGLDLALTDDTSALVLVFPPMAEDEKWRFVPFFWIPEANIKARVEKHHVPYDTWRDLGFLITTPGKVTDHDFIAGAILDLSQTYDLRELAYDPALASGLIKRVIAGRERPLRQEDLDKGIPAGWSRSGDKVRQKGLKEDKIVKFAQTIMNYASPCGDFVRAIAREEIAHDADPVLRWQITNLRWLKNHTGLIMPDKLKSVEKIDGDVAAIMGFGRASHPDNAKILKGKPKVTVL